MKLTAKISTIFCLSMLVYGNASAFANPPEGELFARHAIIPQSTNILAAPVWIQIPYQGSNSNNIGVWDETANTWVPRSLEVTNLQSDSPKVIGLWINGRAFGANDPRLFSEPIDKFGTTTIRIAYNKKVGMDSITISFPTYAETPDKIGINALLGDEFHTILTPDDANQRAKFPRKNTNNQVRFPFIVTDEFEVILVHNDPLFISALPSPDFASKPTGYTVGFLQEPRHNYRIFVDGIRLPKQYQYADSPSWPSYKDRNVISIDNFAENPIFIDSDADGDNISDQKDNCQFIANAPQEDTDRNGIGDACDDIDGDGIVNIRDNCAYIHNTSQEDLDADGSGDKCDNSDDRLGEKHPWLAWLGIGFAALSLIGLSIAQFSYAQKPTNS